MSEKKNSKLEKLHKCFSACKTAFYYSLLFSFISNLMSLAIPIYSLQLLDRVISSSSGETLLMLTVIVILALACFSLLAAVRSFIMINVSSWLDRSLSPMLLEQGLSNNSLRSSVFTSEYLQDLMYIKKFITGPAMNSMLNAPWSLIFLTVLFFIHPTIGTLSLAGGLILLSLAAFNEISTKRIIDSESNYILKSMHYADTASRNAEVIEAMGMHNNIITTWQREHKKSLLLQEKVSSYDAAFNNITKFTSLVIQVCVAGTGAYYVINSQISIGAMIASSILIARALSPFEEAVSSWKSFVNARHSFRKLTKWVASSPARKQSINLPTPTGSLSLENVYYAPIGQNRPTISDVSFKIDSGSILTITGPSAAGKSTIAKLITGIFKTASGSVRLDGADVYTWPRERFGSHIGYLPQDVSLFPGTVKNNIARMDENASDEAVIEAAQKANIHNIILRLPDGYDTKIGVGGIILSSGQRQLIGLARAFFGNPSLLILDEPNSSLDKNGKSALLDAILEAKISNITTIIISDDQELLDIADKILVLNNGKIEQFGETDAILNNIKTTDTAIMIKKVHHAN